MFDWIYNIYNNFTQFIKDYVFGFAKFVDDWFGGIVIALLAFLWKGVPWLLKRFFPAAIILSATTFLQQGTAMFVMAWAWSSLAKLIGITVVGYVGWNVFIPHVEEFISSAFSSLPKQLLPVIEYMSVKDAINFIFSVFFWVATINAAKYIFKPPMTGN